MSFCRANDCIQEGDCLIIYLSFNNLYPIKVKKGQSFQTKYGSMKHNELVGKKFGSEIKCSNGVVYALQGSPEMWTISLPHRTQILYTPDISLITLQLELKPGSVVIESGTGSGSLSHAIIRSVFPTGHLHTFDFHEKRCEIARNEFQEHGLSDYVTVTHRDVCMNGFGVTDLADAVFLDLPNPWKSIQFAKDAIKPIGGRICSFSPCIEQVQKTSEELAKLGFTEITTLECLRRLLSVKKYIHPEFDFSMNDKSKRDAAVEPEKKKRNGKKIKKDGDEDNSQGSGADDADDGDNDDVEGETDPNAVSNFVSYASKPINMQPGHTGYLTFATLLSKI